jgi:hypothetical protein
LKSERASLAGLTGVYVLIEDLGDGGKAAGMDEDTLRTSVELPLRQAGIRVLTIEQQAASKRAPALYVNVHILPEELCDGTRFPVAISVAVQQAVWIDATPRIPVYGATTWSVTSLGYAGGKEALKQLVAEGIDAHLKAFLNDYLAANPRPQQAPK